MRRNTLRAVLLLAMAFLLLTGCSQGALIGTRVEAAQMSFILPEGWDYEEAKVFSADTGEAAVHLYPPGLERERWVGIYLSLMNVSYYQGLLRGSPFLLTHYESGMTVDEWAQAQIAFREKIQPEGIDHYSLIKVSKDVSAIHKTGEREEPDSMLYLRVIDDLAVRLSDAGAAGLTEEEQALLVKIIESVQPLE